jgi:hypothetical protein
MYALNEVVTLKKTHPCGGSDWKIVRVGADIKLQCVTCGKYINLTREELRKNAKEIANLGGM